MKITLAFTDEKLKNDPEAQKWLSQCGRVIKQELDQMTFDLDTFDDTPLLIGDANEKHGPEETV